MKELTEAQEKRDKFKGMIKKAIGAKKYVVPVPMFNVCPISFRAHKYGITETQLRMHIEVQSVTCPLRQVSDSYTKAQFLPREWVCHDLQICHKLVHFCVTAGKSSNFTTKNRLPRKNSRDSEGRERLPCEQHDAQRTFSEFSLDTN